MKIQCNVCEAAEANVLCCADEAALCWNCDQKVHAANKLARKHQRVPLFSSLSEMPKCDICQEMVGYFFCLEDRALLCRKCDVAIHTVNSLVSAHQRFLLTGVKVGLGENEPGSSSCAGRTSSSEIISETEPQSVSKRMSYNGGSATGSVSQWPLEEFLGLCDFNPNYNFVNSNSSKVDSGKLGDSDCFPVVRAADGILGGDECMNHVPDAFWAVPQITSPPAASGLYWPKNYRIQWTVQPRCPKFVPQLQNSILSYIKRRFLARSEGGSCDGPFELVSCAVAKQWHASACRGYRSVLRVLPFLGVEMTC